MSRESLVFLLGLLVFLTPFLGVPSSWKEYVFIGGGVLLMLLGYSLRRSAYLRRIDTGNGERRADSFVESKAPQSSESNVSAGDSAIQSSNGLPV